jgi:hypothetical protein
MAQAKSKSQKAWCVQHRDGWCLCKHQPEAGQAPDESQNQVETACGHFVILPFGFEQRDPNCSEPECKNGEIPSKKA